MSVATLIAEARRLEKCVAELEAQRDEAQDEVKRQCCNRAIGERRESALAKRVAELESALRDIAAQDLDGNGEPDTAGHMANYLDAGALAEALVYCAAKAREALKGGG
jgi:hypothetical protein